MKPTDDFYQFPENGMSTTPRTDEVYDRRLAPEKSGITGHELSKQLETELAAMKARAEKAEAALAARDAEYMRGGKMLAESAAGWQARAEKAKAKIITARSALSRIANSDYRGNRSTESQIAFAALEEIK